MKPCFHGSVQHRTQFCQLTRESHFKMSGGDDDRNENDQKGAEEQTRD